MKSEWLLVTGIATLLACTAGLLVSSSGHWLAWIDGQVVGVGLIVASILGS